jgi:hypothetical protein
VRPFLTTRNGNEQDWSPPYIGAAVCLCLRQEIYGLHHQMRSVLLSSQLKLSYIINIILFIKLLKLQLQTCKQRYPRSLRDGMSSCHVVDRRGDTTLTVLFREWKVVRAMNRYMAPHHSTKWPERLKSEGHQAQGPPTRMERNQRVATMQTTI